MSLEKAVAAKLAAQRGHDDAAALWKKLWTAYEKAGAEAAQALLEELREAPEDGEEAKER